MKRVSVKYNEQMSEFEIKLVDLNGGIQRFNLHGIGMIELIMEIKRETFGKTGIDEKTMKPILKLIRGGDC